MSAPDVGSQLVDWFPGENDADRRRRRARRASLETRTHAERVNGSGPHLTEVQPIEQRPYRLYSAGGLDDLPPAEWIIDQAIPRNGFVGAIGAKGQMKTFFALDLALHVASGLEWHGRKVTPGPVVYIFAEGPFGAKARVDAWCAFQSYATGLPFNRAELTAWFLPSRVPMNQAGAVAGLIVEIDALPVPPVLIVVDTLNQNLDGDEDGKGMTGFVAGCARLQRAFGATVLAVHHTPQADDARGRGHGAFDGALDTRLMVSRDADRVTVECTHQRNAPDGWSVAFETFSIAGSVALKPSALNAGQLNGQRRKCLDLLHQQGTSTYSAWIALTELKPSSFRKARSWLLANAYARQDGKHYTATDAGVLALGHQGHQEGTRD